MGACDVSFTIGKQATIAEIKSYLQKRIKEDRDRNGHQDGYSGDFQTIPEVKFHLSQVFSSKNEAYEYCLANSEKWSHAVAVYYTQVTVERTKTQIRLEEKIVKLKEEQRLLYRFTEKIGYVKCSHCGSRLNKKFMLHKTCRLCDQSLLTRTELRRAERIAASLKAAELQLSQLIEKQKQKALEKNKNKNIKTLVAGWAAC